jgi:hypothetical protein
VHLRYTFEVALAGKDVLPCVVYLYNRSLLKNPQVRLRGGGSRQRCVCVWRCH